MTEYQPFSPNSGPVMVPAAGFAPPPPPGYQPMQVAPQYLEQLPDEGDALATPPEKGKRLSRFGGRTPLIALVLVLLLGAAGAAYGTGMFSKKADTPAPIVHKRPAATAPVASTPAVVAPVTPVAKPLVGKLLALTKANSGTLGGPYSVTVPAGWGAKLNGESDESGHLDITIGHQRSGQAFMLASLPQTYVKGPLTPAVIAKLRADFSKGDSHTKVLPGRSKVMTVAGVPGNTFNATTEINGMAVSMQVVAFARGTTVYQAVWISRPENFATSLRTFNQLLATVKFAK